MAEELSENIGSEIRIKQGSGHFNTDSGYESFSELWELMEKEI
jgi:predicted alpha/beta hydrolase family esterase